MAATTVRIISRYLLRQHLAPLAFALTALTSVMLLNQVAKQFTNLVGKDLPWSVIGEVFLLSIPFIVAVTLPMAVLVAVLYTFSHLAADNEITVMKASGISVVRLVLPVLGGAAVVSVLAFIWSDQLLPRSNHALRTLSVDIQRMKPSFTLREQVINEVQPQRFFLRASRIDQTSNKLRGVSIYDLEDPDRRRVIRADSGRMAYTPGGADLYLTLHDGEIQEVSRTEPAQFSRTFFQTNVIRIEGLGREWERTEADTYRSDREMSVCQMERTVRQAQADAISARDAVHVAIAGELRGLAGLPVPRRAARDSAPPLRPSWFCSAWTWVGRLMVPDTVHAQAAGRVTVDSVDRSAAAAARRARPAAAFGGAGTLPEEASVRSSRQRAAAYLVEIHKKLAIAAACLVFTLIGIPIALRFPRGGIGLVIGVSLAVFTIYYIGLIGGEDLGDRLIVTPFIAMWAPNLIFSGVGLLGLWSLRREGWSARGGGWAELRDLFRPPGRRRRA